ncbi:Hpt domain-containing protein [Pseudomonas rubra]|uniref:histidine kinase n=1 Tax=Pseudomonas rubra TaxID=2942627 RepID=A0ABT5P718_9PSED|nr:Hpt domain-containing protein [Pseudomonas rubra]MDD1014085.1 Hpt domain-containing protein [Pseudomonas rubra]MDD1039019.1 Hpt domain-containing protein [Pseudomonas rubra]MDD1154227.1 Hpt domain-containing protein [Pseudomonas rubra]
MADRHDTVALAWVKGSIADCLGQARQTLEHFAAEPGDEAVLDGFIEQLHQVRGCLLMLELNGAALLAEEMEQLGLALRQGRANQRGEALGALFRGLEQLPLYLERLRSARRDLPLVVLPVLNQLRAERGAGALAQDSLLASSPADAEQLANLDLYLGTWRDRLQAGPDRDALRSVVAALCEDLKRVKERLDQFVRGDRQHLGELEPLLAPLRQIADTLAVLGFGQPRRVIIDQVLVLQSLAQGQREPADALLMDIAGALLYVEATLAGMVGPLEQNSQSPLPGTDLAEIRQLVLEEAYAVLQQVKDQIGDCLDAGWQPQRLQGLPGLLQQIRGALAMLMLPRAAALIGHCGDYVQQRLLSSASLTDPAALGHLAEALSACECYLQWLIADPQANPSRFLEVAQNSLGMLGYRLEAEPVVVEAAPLAVLEDPPVDDELREIFLEEANELLPLLNAMWARWQADGTDREALIELRRGLHTLKGSGRMVCAQVLAELAWAAEHFLNRVLEGRVEIGQAPLAALQQALGQLPVLLGEFARGQAPAHAEIEQLAAHLHALAMNDPHSQAEASEAIDPQLLEIFRNEALGHLDSLEVFLREADRHLPLAVSDSLQRALHTLKGSAAMAGVLPIAELAGGLDLLAREFKAHQLVFDLEEIYLLETAEPLLRRGLQQLFSTPLAPIAGAATLIADIHQVVDARLQALLVAPSQGLRVKRDPQLIASFLAQGMDILLDAESLLLRWQEHPGERQELSALLDELTTLGQSAHLADLWQVDELCEALLDLYGAVEESSLAVSARFFSEAQGAHEALIDMLDQIAAGQEVAPRPERLQALRDLLAEGLDPSAMGLVSSQGGAVTELASATAELAAQVPDPAVLELFLDEANDILDSAGQALARWLLDIDNASALSSLSRDLQTLKGGAQMATLGAFEALAQELELLYEGLVDRRFSAGAELFALLKRSHQQLAHMLEQLQQGQLPTAQVELLAALREFRHDAPQPTPVEKPVEAQQDAGDKELLEIFLEESLDLVESSSAALLRWQAEPRNGVEVENLLRDLHTLKGGARMVEIAPIGDLAHELEFLYELLAAGQLQPSAALFSLLQNCHDRLAHMLDAVRLQQPLHAATALIDYIRNFSSAALADAGASQALADTAPPELPVTAPERGAGDMVKVASELLDDLGNLAGENSIIRGRIEQQVNDAQVALSEMETTLERMRDQLRRLDTETQGRILSRQADGDGQAYEDFDPLEMDRHSQLQQLSRALFESASDLLDLKETLSVRAHDAQSLLQQQARVNSELQEGLMRTRMVPFERLVPRLQRVVRQVSSELGKQVELVVGNAEGEMDRSVLERMMAPLEHMLRNAVDHGLESREARLAAGKSEQGLICLNLLHEGADIVIEMSDDGAGVPLEAVRRKAIKRGLLDPAAVLSDHEIMQFILQPGFSTAEKITQISGRGLGMDVVHEEVKQLGGSMVIESNPGKGARFLIRLPFTVSINRGLMVHYGEEQYAIPLNTIEGIVRVPPAELEACYQLDPPYYQYAGHRYALHYLGELLQGATQPKLLGQSLPLPVLLVHSHDQQYAVQVDGLAASREIVVKSLGPQFAAVQGLSGATLLGDGRVVLILDLPGQLRGLQQMARHHPGSAGQRRDSLGSLPARPLLVMVVDDSVTVRKVTGRLLERHGMNVLTAKDGVDAMALLQEHRPDILLLDIEMPRMDGFEVATQIRHDPQLKDLPIIMITSRTGQKHRDRAIAIGVNDYLGKPYQESVLLQSIAQWSHRDA